MMFQVFCKSKYNKGIGDSMPLISVCVSRFCQVCVSTRAWCEQDINDQGFLCFRW